VSLYLIINLAAISIPFIFTFHPKLRFYEKWKGFFIGTLLIGGIFIVWDVIFTKLGIWGFNPVYLSGIDLINLPIEEWLFFLCIPYASIFTHYSLIKLKKFQLSHRVTNVISILVSGLCFVIAVVYPDRMYTFVTSIYTIATVLLGWLYFRPVLQRFYLSYAVVLVPFFIVNGVLTGSFIKDEVVWYNNSENLGVRLFTIPVEDAFYGFSLLLGIVLVCELFYKLVQNRKIEVSLS
jgi:lycopene cyclase domain-containing protein